MHLAIVRPIEAAAVTVEQTPVGPVAFLDVGEDQDILALSRADLERLARQVHEALAVVDPVTV